MTSTDSSLAGHGHVSTRGRILSIDAARGMLMIFSCLSHFGWWIHSVYANLGSTLIGTGMVATPGFLLVSGAMVSLLCARSPRGSSDLKSQLFNRGLFLLTVGHLLISLSEAHADGGLMNTLPGVSVVDEIGLCTLIAAFMINRLADPRVCRFAAWGAVAVLLMCWSTGLWWHPASQTTLAMKDLLIGGNVLYGSAGLRIAPTLQYMALYTLGLPLGHLLSKYCDGALRRERFTGRLASFGIGLVVLSCLLRAGRYAIDHIPALAPIQSPQLDITLQVSSKIPPSPAYLLFYGGMALLLVASALYVSGIRSKLICATLDWFAVIGRASLFAFVLQYFLYWTLPDLLGITPNRWCLVIFVANALVMHRAAAAWGRFHGNDHFTFGIRLGRGSSA